MSTTPNELPPSCLLVIKALEEADHDLTQSGVVEESRLKARTARFALTRLENANIVEKRPSTADARQSRYSLVEIPEISAT